MRAVPARARWAASSFNRRVGWRALLGLPLGGAGLLLPWLGTPFTPAWRSFSLPVRLVGAAFLAHFSYGVAVAFSLAIAGLIVAFAPSAHGRRAASSLAGWALLSLALLFVVATRTGDSRLLFLLRSAQSEYQVVTDQFGYQTSQYPAVDIFSYRPDQMTLTLFGDLGAGWYVTLAGGLVMARRPGLPRRARAYLAVPAVVVAGALAYGVGTGLWAQHLKLAGIAAERAGAPATATGDLDDALAVDPSLQYDPDWVLGLGIAELEKGDTTTAFARYADAVTGVGGAPSQQVMNWYLEALRDAPWEPVIQQQVAETASSYRADSPAFLAITAGILAQPAKGPLLGEDIMIAYSLGRYYYSTGANALAVRYLELADAGTTSADIKSSCLTYIALAELGLGNQAAFRHYIIAAVEVDPGRTNPFATEISTGLYMPGTP